VGPSERLCRAARALGVNGGQKEEGGGDAVFDSNPFGFIYDEARSRCEQYGGHWSGHKCVGVRSGRPSKSACDFVAGGAGTVVGSAVGSVVGPAGTFGGGLVGGWLGSQVCG
jgi:hypothetical protein